ncbi:RNA-binding cell elongation regulator Jag/EloR [Lentilactobacillus otakiensis]|uniref:RNA-binding protein KhpB n=1 Tax=Lentilactobacillus otakiensis DSM 19908 = JCM 15040 TaxID=1423780 RepID=S4NTA9_9LACO|nr:RNA-binding cell elongation regulator Jag/EloR [Lentilactobacillus otakiensis]KRL10862.1 single-stranded nucleic acid binding R3H domain-containing protein [Lentilactobacillus otakiensis DSM 19908 = JCM 15040]MBZ3777446.1 protein jag [Lentilactobacillus otakiensis]MDV3517690.1 RNA-binding cell elongation regulator Jag/EloR [Lentilactobacillus otakiensis]GAD17198.1 single-stranded nucleic acid binding R3H domain-containing protein [Lentilactobacillus otakiensis DSM 19908 = JCM 15040]
MTIYSGKTIQDAVEQGLTALSLTQDQVEVTVIQQPKNGFLGFGRKLAQVELAKKSNTQTETITDKPSQKPVYDAHTDSEETENTIDVEEVSQKLANYLNDVLEAMGFSFKLKLDLKSRHSIYIDIDTDQESRLIGRHGRTINALQNLSQIFINRLGANNVNVELDTANYRSRRSESLVQLADKTARNAIANGKPVYLNPMPAFERKQIHNALADNDHVMTYSTGKEPHRVIVVAPK